MKKNLIAGLVLASAFAVVSPVRAQDAGTQKVAGTLGTIQGEHMMMKSDAGDSVMVMLDEKTTITRDKKKVDAKSLKTGDHVVVEGPGDKSMLTAKTVEVGPAPKPAKK